MGDVPLWKTTNEQWFLLFCLLRKCTGVVFGLFTSEDANVPSDWPPGASVGIERR